MILIVSPFLLGFNRGGPETWTPIILGASTLSYSVLTDYELGLIRRISMPMHLWLDAFSGLLLALSPWLFGFSDIVWAPHLALGMLELGAVMMTDPHPSTTRTAVERVLR
jgi:hypothetical protein